MEGIDEYTAQEQGTNPPLIKGISDENLSQRIKDLIYIMKGFLVDERVKVSMQIAEPCLWFRFELTYSVGWHVEPYLLTFVRGDILGVKITPVLSRPGTYFNFVKTQVYGNMRDIFLALEEEGLINSA